MQFFKSWWFSLDKNNEEQKYIEHISSPIEVHLIPMSSELSNNFTQILEDEEKSLNNPKIYNDFFTSYISEFDIPLTIDNETFFQKQHSETFLSWIFNYFMKTIIDFDQQLYISFQQYTTNHFQTDLMFNLLKVFHIICRYPPNRQILLKMSSSSFQYQNNEECYKSIIQNIVKFFKIIVNRYISLGSLLNNNSIIKIPSNSVSIQNSLSFSDPSSLSQISNSSWYHQINGFLGNLLHQLFDIFSLFVDPFFRWRVKSYPSINNFPFSTSILTPLSNLLSYLSTIIMEQSYCSQHSKLIFLLLNFIGSLITCNPPFQLFFFHENGLNHCLNLLSWPLLYHNKDDEDITNIDKETISFTLSQHYNIIILILQVIRETTYRQKDIIESLSQSGGFEKIMECILVVNMVFADHDSLSKTDNEELIPKQKSFEFLENEYLDCIDITSEPLPCNSQGLLDLPICISLHNYYLSSLFDVIFHMAILADTPINTNPKLQTLKVNQATSINNLPIPLSLSIISEYIIHTCVDIFNDGVNITSFNQLSRQYLRYGLPLCQQYVLMILKSLISYNPLFINYFRQYHLYFLLFSDFFFFLPPYHTINNIDNPFSIFEHKLVGCGIRNSGDENNNDCGYKSIHQQDTLPDDKSCSLSDLINHRQYMIRKIRVDILHLLEYICTFDKMDINDEIGCLLDVLQSHSNDFESVKKICSCLINILKNRQEKTIEALLDNGAFQIICRIIADQQNQKTLEIQTFHPYFNQSRYSILRLLDYFLISNKVQHYSLKHSYIINTIFSLLFEEEPFRSFALRLVVKLLITQGELITTNRILGLLPETDSIYCYDEMSDIHNTRSRSLSITSYYSIPSDDLIYEEKNDHDLFSEFGELFSKIIRNQTNIDLIFSLLSSLRQVLNINTTENQRLFQKNHIFLQVVSLLNCDWSKYPPSVPRRICFDVLQTITSLLKNNPLNKKCFRETIGYPQFMNVLLEAENHHPSPYLFDILLDMMVDGKYLCGKDIYIIQNYDVIWMLFQLLQYSDNEFQYSFLNKFTDIISYSILNKSFCCLADLFDILIEGFSSLKNIELCEINITLMGMLGSHMITVKQLKSYFSLMKPLSNKGQQFRKGYTINLLKSFHDMKIADNPTYFFYFDGIVSGLQLPIIKEWPSRGYTFSIWLRVEEYYNPSLHISNNNLQYPTILSFSSADEKGLHVYYDQDHLTLYVNSGTDKISTVTINYTFKLQTWYHMVITHNRSRAFVSSEVRVYINSVIIAQQSLVYPLNTIPLSRCFIGTEGTSSPQSFYGQMGAIYFFDDTLNTAQIISLYQLGSRYYDVFNHSEKLPVTCKNILNGDLTNKILLCYNAKAVDENNNIAFDISPNKKIINNSNAIMLCGTFQCITNKITEMLDCLGGVKVLFPLFAQIDLKVIKGVEYHKIEMENIDSVIFDPQLNAEFLILLINTINEMTIDHISNQNFMTDEGFGVLSHLLGLLPPYLFRTETVDAIVKLISSVSFDSSSYCQAFIHLLLNFSLWIYTPFTLQLVWTQKLIQIISTRPSFFREELGFQIIFDRLRFYCWYKPEHDSQTPHLTIVHSLTQDIVGQRPSKDEMAQIRQKILDLIPIMLGLPINFCKMSIEDILTMRTYKQNYSTLYMLSFKEIGIFIRFLLDIVDNDQRNDIIHLFYLLFLFEYYILESNNMPESIGEFGGPGIFFILIQNTYDKVIFDELITILTIISCCHSIPRINKIKISVFLKNNLHNFSFSINSTNFCVNLKTMLMGRPFHTLYNSDDDVKQVESSFLSCLCAQLATMSDISLILNEIIDIQNIVNKYHVKTCFFKNYDIWIFDFLNLLLQYFPSEIYKLSQKGLCVSLPLIKLLISLLIPEFCTNNKSWEYYQTSLIYFSYFEKFPLWNYLNQFLSLFFQDILMIKEKKLLKKCRNNVKSVISITENILMHSIQHRSQSNSLSSSNDILTSLPISDFYINEISQLWSIIAILANLNQWIYDNSYDTITKTFEDNTISLIAKTLFLSSLPFSISLFSKEQSPFFLSLLTENLSLQNTFDKIKTEVTKMSLNKKPNSPVTDEHLFEPDLIYNTNLESFQHQSILTPHYPASLYLIIYILQILFLQIEIFIQINIDHISKPDLKEFLFSSLSSSLNLYRSIFSHFSDILTPIMSNVELLSWDPENFSKSSKSAVFHYADIILKSSSRKIFSQYFNEFTKKYFEEQKSKFLIFSENFSKLQQNVNSHVSSQKTQYQDIVSEIVSIQSIHSHQEQIRRSKVVLRRNHFQKICEHTWVNISRSLTNERAPWYSQEEHEEFWTLDLSENSSRMRKKLLINYEGNKHIGASQTAQQSTEEENVISFSPIPSEIVMIDHNTPKFLEKIHFNYTRQANEEKILQKLKEEPDPEWNLLDPDDQMHFRNISTAASEEKVCFFCECSMVTPLLVTLGLIELTNTHLYFYEGRESINLRDDQKEKRLPLGEKDYKWRLSDIREIHYRRHQLSRNSVEIFFSDRTTNFFRFETEKIRKKFINHMKKLKPSNVIIWNVHVSVLKKLTEQWQKHFISNFDYLMQLNSLAGRTYNDLNQYPVFPWILQDYTSQKLNLNDESIYRDLTKPIGALEKNRLERYIERYQGFADNQIGIPPFLYGTHYSSSASVLYFLIRQEPFTSKSIELQGGKFDFPDRMFDSIASTWLGVLINQADVKELIPEFFYFPEFLTNHGHFYFGVKQDNSPINNVVLPNWAKTPEEFIRLHRAALESNYVSKNLHHWIDLIFGYKQRGPNSVLANNVFHYLTYEDNVNLDTIEDPVEREATIIQIDNFGQTPSQLFTEPHPKKHDLPPCLSLFSILENEYELEIDGELKEEQKQYNYHLFRLEKITSENIPLYFVAYIPNETILSFEEFDRVITIDANRLLLQHKWKHGLVSYDPPFTFEKEIEKNLKDTKTIGTHFVQGLPIHGPFFTISNDGRFILSYGHWDCTFKCSSVETGKVLQSIIQHNDIVTCMSIDQNVLATGSCDSTVILWEIFDGSRQIFVKEKPLHILHGHDDIVLSVCLNLDYDLVLSGSRDGTVIIHSTLKGLYVRTIRIKEKLSSSLTELYSIDLVSLSSQGDIVIYSRFDQMLHLYSINAKHLISFDTYDNLTVLLFSHDGRYLLTGGSRSIIKIRRTYDLKVLREISIPKNDSFEHSIRYLCLSKDEQYLFVCLHNGRLAIISISSKFFRELSLKRLTLLSYEL